MLNFKCSEPLSLAGGGRGADSCLVGDDGPW